MFSRWGLHGFDTQFQLLGNLPATQTGARQLEHVQIRSLRHARVPLASVSRSEETAQ